MCGGEGEGGWAGMMQFLLLASCDMERVESDVIVGVGVVRYWVRGGCGGFWCWCCEMRGVWEMMKCCCWGRAEPFVCAENGVVVVVGVVKYEVGGVWGVFGVGTVKSGMCGVDVVLLLRSCGIA